MPHCVTRTREIDDPELAAPVGLIEMPVSPAAAQETLKSRSVTAACVVTEIAAWPAAVGLSVVQSRPPPENSSAPPMTIGGPMLEVPQGLATGRFWAVAALTAACQAAASSEPLKVTP